MSMSSGESVAARALRLADVVVREAAPADDAALLDLHRRSFAVPWSARRWRQRYGGGAPTVVVGAFAGEACVGMFCGALLPARLGGRRGLVCRGGDVAVHPDLQASAAGPRLLLRLADAFAHALARSGCDMVFGFPGPGLSRTLIRRCRYEVLGDVIWLVRGADTYGAAGAEISCGPVVAIDGLLGGWLERLGVPAGDGLVRDLAYLRWRYLDVPDDGHETAYRLLLARDRAGPRGLAVARRDPSQGALLVHEWLAPEADEPAFAALVNGACALAREEGCRDVVTAQSGRAPRFAALQAQHGFRAVVSPYQLVYRPFSRDLTRASLFERWSLSPGDLDFA